MRLDQLLVYLRFARSRSRAQALIERGHFRINRKPVMRPSAPVGAGDVLTFALRGEVRVVRILALPEARISARLARNCYRDLDRSAQTAIAALHPARVQEDFAP